MALGGDTFELSEHHPGPRHVVRSAARALLTTAVVMGLYFLAPLEDFTPGIALMLVGGIVVLTVVVVLQIRAILRAQHPGLRAIEALAASTPLFLAVFSFTYVLIARSDPDAFTQTMSRLDALYFTTTVFSTVGFGDITARTGLARGVVTIQMLADLVVLGLGLRVIMGAVRLGQARRSAGVPAGRQRRRGSPGAEG